MAKASAPPSQIESRIAAHEKLAEAVVREFIEAEFTGEDRHRRRLDKIKALES